MPRRALPPHLERHLARQLEHLPVQEEEAGEPELGDQRELLVEPRARLAAIAASAGSALSNSPRQSRASWASAGSSPSEKSG